MDYERIEVKSMSMQIAESIPLYPKKVLIPDEYLTGRPDAHIIRKQEIDYYSYRDMTWELIFIEKNNPYTGDPYFLSPKPWDQNKYEWSDIVKTSEFEYVIECNIPTNLAYNYKTCLLSISYNFRTSSTDIHFKLFPLNSMQTTDSIKLRFNFLILGVGNARFYKDYLRVWFSALYDSYKVLFLKNQHPSSWEPVTQYVMRKCVQFEKYLREVSNDEVILRRRKMLHFLLPGNSQSSPWLKEIQRQDIAKMIWEEAENLGVFMEQLCKRL